MPAVRCSLSRFGVALLVLISVAAFHHARAQSANSSDPIDLLRNLTPEQRAEVSRQLGGAVADQATSASGRARTSGQQDQDPSRQDNQQQSRDRRGETEEEEYGSLTPVLKGEDTVIIRIDRHRFDPNTPPAGTFPQGPAAPATPGTQPQQAVVPQPAPASNLSLSQREREMSLTLEEQERLDGLVELVRSKNPYQLSRDGVLTLPGFARIPLAGLTEFQATVRLQAAPELRDVDVALIRLPLKKFGVLALKPFGYDLFERAPSTFAPVTNVPVPSDYVVGAGDQLEVQLYGNQNRLLRLDVGRDGLISFPELGPISVAGQSFRSVKSSIESRVERQMIGVRANVSMGDTRSIRVFVLGEARRPGSYVISGLGTITSALFAAGGVKPIGSLRTIELRRQGALVRRLDLYDMLIRGDTTDDAKLLPGDVVFIPPVGPTVTMDGEVRRPAIYEVGPKSTVADLVGLAGGLTAEADTAKAALTRINENRNRIVTTVDVGSGAAAQPLRNGDLLRVPRLRPTVDSGVTVEGHVYAPTSYAFRDGMRLSDVVRSVDDLRPDADIHYVVIRREVPPNREVKALSADLGAALREPGSAADVLLMARDRITVFDLQTTRDRVIRPLLDELRLQSTLARPTEVVGVDGRVKVPGEYPLEPGMMVRDLIRAGGGLSDAAYSGEAELTRYTVVNGDSRRTELIRVNLAALLRGEQSANILLQPFDRLSIKEIPEWGDQEEVTLQGEVRFSGRFAIKRGETLRSVLERAGGLTEYAFPEGSVFTRKELKEREQKQLDLLATRLQNDLVTLALQGAAANQSQAGTAMSVGQSLLTQVRAAKSVGRLVIDLPRALRAQPGSAADVIMRDGDRLIVPRFQQEVTVIGEVQTATSHLYRTGLGRDDYIALSGGTTRRADKSQIYVVRADGSVVANVNDRWFNRSGAAIHPGDTIVVPLDTERMPSLPFWQAVTQIIYNLAISAAAVNSFQN